MIERIRGIFTIVQMGITVIITIIAMYLFKNSNRKIRRIWGYIQFKLLNIKIETEGELDESADMMIMNHQSLLDIVVFEYLHPKNPAWVAKKEIADLPIFGHILKAPKMIIIERESKSSLIKLLKDTKEKIAEGRPILIFPEGTRSDGTKIRKFKVGAKMIANKFKLKVQPVVLVGTNDIFDSKKLKQKGGIVKIVYLPTIQADKKNEWYDEVETNMRNILEKELKNR